MCAESNKNLNSTKTRRGTDCVNEWERAGICKRYRGFTRSDYNTLTAPPSLQAPTEEDRTNSAGRKGGVKSQYTENFNIDLY